MTRDDGHGVDTGHGTDTGGDDARDAPTDDPPGHADESDATDGSERRTIHATRGLVEVLLELAEDAEPRAVNVVLAATPAGEFGTDLGLDPETPVLTHFYLPDAGRAVSAVFGIDLGTPAGRGRGRFVTHPQGPFALTERDDLAGVVLLAVPPWDERTLGAFDRAGRALDLVVVDAEPPVEELA